MKEILMDEPKTEFWKNFEDVFEQNLLNQRPMENSSM